ncbi:unnamed protein product [Periconia digitata]|uniref:Uncharacterized protein n=1 Tax=Periconia digitata TaxID=1303443 RepID=A0A9W4U2Y0_9PLEO|nr:unnamed protein product [Periconia digitata]
MKLTTALLSLLSATTATATATATALTPRQDPQPQPSLQPFTLNTFTIHVPSARAGTYAFSTLTTNITDPNSHVLNPSHTLPPSTAQNCRATFLTLSSPTEGPWGRTWPCDDDGRKEGYWSMRVEQIEGGYRMVWRRTAAIWDKAALKGYTRVFEGSRELRVGEDIKVGCANGDGTCSYWLGAPVEVEVKEIEGESA